MSKSYSKIKKFGICTGSNTEYYRDKRKNIRVKEKQVIHNTLAHYDISEFDEVYTPLNIPFKDDWDEPTDGTIPMDAKEINKCGGYDSIYITKDGKIKK